MNKQPYIATSWFEKELCRYTGAPFAVAVDNCSSALHLALLWKNISGKEIEIPSHTYMSVPCAIIHAGGRVRFVSSPVYLKGEYQIGDTGVWDSALRFTHNMYLDGQIQCLSFTGPYKRLKLGKGGAILTDSELAYKWFKRARFSGRRECSYHEDTFDMIGFNYYMMPDVALRGLQLMGQFYDPDGQPLSFPDIELPYPDLSIKSIYENLNR
jgi:dTDP-4-amino-4,6-dideoxygalactose transaminase